jgi:hypothetical protein
MSAAGAAAATVEQGVHLGGGGWLRSGHERTGQGWRAQRHASGLGRDGVLRRRNGRASRYALGGTLLVRGCSARCGLCSLQLVLGQSSSWNSGRNSCSCRFGVVTVKLSTLAGQSHGQCTLVCRLAPETGRPVTRPGRLGSPDQPWRSGLEQPGVLDAQCRSRARARGERIELSRTDRADCDPATLTRGLLDFRITRPVAAEGNADRGGDLCEARLDKRVKFAGGVVREVVTQATSDSHEMGACGQARSLRRLLGCGSRPLGAWLASRGTCQQGPKGAGVTPLGAGGSGPRAASQLRDPEGMSAAAPQVSTRGPWLARQIERKNSRQSRLPDSGR